MDLLKKKKQSHWFQATQRHTVGSKSVQHSDLLHQSYINRRQYNGYLPVYAKTGRIPSTLQDDKIVAMNYISFN